MAQDTPIGRAPPSTPPRERLTLGGWAWAAYEWGRTPYAIICSVYIFAPYVANVVIGDPDEGLRQIADVNKWAGLVVAILAPVLGAVADRAGRRKIPLALVTALMASSIGLLWFVTPDAPMALWFGLLFAIGVMYNLTEALHNAMLRGASTPETLSTASGLGLGLGSLASVLLLLFTLAFLALPERPLFGLDKSMHEPERAVGPLVGLWFALLAAPLFFLTPDSGRAMGWLRAAREGVASLRHTLRRVRAMPQIARFLIARMFYADAKTAIIVLGGVYASGVMGWGFEEMAVFGIVLSVLAGLGGFVGAWLDRAFGHKRAILIEISFVALSWTLAISIDPDTVLFVAPVSTAPLWDGPIFKTTAEVAYLIAIAPAPIFITAAYASSRSTLALMAPPAMTGELFGLYALSGTATAWLGPALVSTVTGLTGSGQAGAASLLSLLALGFWLLLPLKPPQPG